MTTLYVDILLRPVSAPSAYDARYLSSFGNGLFIMGYDMTWLHTKPGTGWTRAGPNAPLNGTCKDPVQGCCGCYVLLLLRRTTTAAAAATAATAATATTQLSRFTTVPSTTDCSFFLLSYTAQDSMLLCTERSRSTECLRRRLCWGCRRTDVSLLATVTKEKDPTNR